MCQSTNFDSSQQNSKSHSRRNSFTNKNQVANERALWLNSEKETLLAFLDEGFIQDTERLTSLASAIHNSYKDICDEVRYLKRKRRMSFSPSIKSSGKRNSSASSSVSAVTPVKKLCSKCQEETVCARVQDIDDMVFYSDKRIRRYGREMQQKFRQERQVLMQDLKKVE